MHIRSLGWRTDLAVRRLEGAEISDFEDHVIVRSAGNPEFRWGNCMIVDGSSGRDAVKLRLRQFGDAFPHASHVAIGVDDPSGASGASNAPGALGLEITVDAVLTATSLRAPSRKGSPAVFRQLNSDSDWRQATELRLADRPSERQQLEAFIECQMRAIRDVCESGHGGWFGAFIGEEMCSGLGVFDAGAGLARFQAVDTHPSYRRRGLASRLVFTAGQHALREFGASSLVIAADPGYHAIHIYRALGFADCERHIQLERAPT